MAHYLDAKQFTALFRNRKKHHAEICESINTLVRHLVMRTSSTFDGKEVPDGVRRAAHVFDDPATREDAIQSTVVHCIERLDRFNPKRPDANAFSYFTSVAINALRKCQREQAKHKMRAVSIHDVEFDEE